MSVRKQARTRPVSTRSIVASQEFARGLEEVRAGRRFNPDNGDWNYERGRAFGFIAPPREVQNDDRISPTVQGHRN